MDLNPKSGEALEAKYGTDKLVFAAADVTNESNYTLVLDYVNA